MIALPIRTFKLIMTHGILWADVVAVIKLPFLILSSSGIGENGDGAVSLGPDGAPIIIKPFQLFFIAARFYFSPGHWKGHSVFKSCNGQLRQRIDIGDHREDNL